MSDHDALQGFLGKWRARWPDWAVADAFVPADQRERVWAWLALRDELAEAAWGGEDPRPGDAKLGWWADELDGWSRGARRHPLGLALQKVPAPWPGLAACLPALRASRERPAGLDAAGAGVTQVHRDIDLGRDQQRACVAAGQPDRQGQRLHADPVQRARQRRRLVGDVGQGLRVLGRARFHAAILPAPA